MYGCWSHECSSRAEGRRVETVGDTVEPAALNNPRFRCVSVAHLNQHMRTPAGETGFLEKTWLAQVFAGSRGLMKLEQIRRTM